MQPPQQLNMSLRGTHGRHQATAKRTEEQAPPSGRGCTVFCGGREFAPDAPCTNPHHPAQNQLATPWHPHRDAPASTSLLHLYCTCSPEDSCATRRHNLVFPVHACWNSCAVPAGIDDLQHGPVTPMQCRTFLGAQPRPGSEGRRPGPGWRRPERTPGGSGWRRPRCSQCPVYPPPPSPPAAAGSPAPPPGNNHQLQGRVASRIDAPSWLRSQAPESVVDRVYSTSLGIGSFTCWWWHTWEVVVLGMAPPLVSALGGGRFH